MKILVTGGAGFIGSKIADAYIDEGHDVVILDNMSSGKEKNIPEKAKFIKGDIRDKSIVDLFEFEQFDLVSHHAGQIDVRRSCVDPFFDAQVNVIGSIAMLDFCRQFKVKKFVFASTGGAIYGQQDTYPASESHQTRPLSPYGIDKRSVEHYIYWYSQVYGFSGTSLRYANVFGPRQNPHGEAGVIAIWCDKMISGEQPVIYGTGAQTRDFVFIDDVVEANLLVSKLDNCYQIYNIGTGSETSIRTIFREMNKLFGNKFKEIHEDAQPGEQLRSSINSAKAKLELGWQPRVTLQKGLSKTVDYFKELGEHKKYA